MSVDSDESERVRHILACRLEGDTVHLLWFTGEDDGVVVDPRGDLVWFTHARDAVEYAAEKGLALGRHEPTWFDLDSVLVSTRPEANSIECGPLINVWNLFVDIAASIGGRGKPFEELDAEASVLYEKIFYGNNLPEVTPEGMAYHPDVSGSESLQLMLLVEAGTDMLRAELKRRPAEPLLRAE